MAKFNNVNKKIANRLMDIDTSAVPKKAQRKPEIRYTTGLKRVTVCQKGGNIEME